MDRNYFFSIISHASLFWQIKLTNDYVLKRRKYPLKKLSTDVGIVANPENKSRCVET